jgi:pyruvate/2-oxoacid:ferredoxin oxidoreductase alpha subunit
MNGLFSLQDAILSAAKLCSAEILFASPDCKISFNSRSKPETCVSQFPIIAAASSAAMEKRALAVCMIPHIEEIRDAASQRMPVVIVSFANMQDLAPVCDEGCVIMHAESMQDLIDSIILSYKLCEEPKTLLPCIISWSGPIDYIESASVPSDQITKNFITTLKLPHRLDMKKPSLIASGGQEQGLLQQCKAMENFSKSYILADDIWKKKTKRPRPMADAYRTEDAETIIVTYGYHSSTCKAAVDGLRARGKKAGLMKINVLRPFPYNAFNALKGKKIGVLEFCCSPGTSPPVLREVRQFSPNAAGFITIEKYLNEKDFIEIFGKIEAIEKPETFWL